MTSMMRSIRRVVIVSVAPLMVVAATAAAQQRGQSPQTPAPLSAPAPTAVPAASAPGQQMAKPAEAGAPFTFNPEGRRDPFVSLIGRGNDPKAAGARPPGVPGLLINEVSVKGSVKSIVADAVVFSQDVNDPLSLVKQKEIRKPLRTAEGGRG
jgi:hypothetical protein